MSYTVSINKREYSFCPSCNHRIDGEETMLFSANHTSNTGGMIDAADLWARQNMKVVPTGRRDRGINFLGSYKAPSVDVDSTSIEWLELVVQYLGDEDNRAALRKMEPQNGWGCLESTLEFMRDIRNAAWDVGPSSGAYFHVSD